MSKDDTSELVDLVALRQFFEEEIPFHRTLGLSVTRLDRGQAELLVPYGHHLTGNPKGPVLHGGVMASVADAAGGLALLSNLPAHVNLATIDLRIDYIRPAACDDLWCSARIVRLGAQVGFTAMSLVQRGDYIVAEVRAAYSLSRRRSKADS